MRPRPVLAGLLLLAAVVPSGCASPADPAPALPDLADAVAADPPPPDPRLAFDTPYRNVRPGVRYVGDAACAGCHPAVSRAYHQHPMGRSAERLTASGEPAEAFDPAARPWFTVGGFELSAERTDGGLVHRVRARDADPAAEYAPVAAVAVGSGTRGRSYLAEEGGAVWQTAVSWVGPGRHWELSPGFRLGVRARRPVVSDCLFCHVDRVEPVPGAENRYKEPFLAGQVAIGCERCHGPGELHAAERAAGPAPAGPDTSLVNPRHLPPALQAAVCEQCHLQGEQRVARRGRDLWEYRPGLPFEQFASVHTRPPEQAERHKSVGQFEQMERSKCFTAAGGRMVCTTCHDPHAAPAPAAAAAHYRARCLTCHEQKGCTAPAPDRQARADSCIACHMPKADSANIVHASVTDHRVPRRPGAVPPPQPLPFGAPPLVRFRDTPYSPPPGERDRDLGIALARFAASADGDAGAAGRTLAVDRLTAALRLWPGDADAWAALAAVKDGRAGAAEKLRVAANAAKLAPESEAALTGLAAAAAAADRLDLAEGAAAKLISLAPGSHEAWLTRGFVRVRRKEWDGAAADCREAARLHPLHPEARLYLAIATHHLGDPAGARQLARTAAALEDDPRRRAELLNWFREGIR